MNLREKAICVPPAGCAVLAYNYIDIDMVEAPHGRATAVATGIKRVRPDNLVFSYQGDGDLAAIGTAEALHAANRGENITVIFVNNAVYGMTGGQMAPTSLAGPENHHLSRWDGTPEREGPAHQGLRSCWRSLAARAILSASSVNTPAAIRKTKEAIAKGI